MHAFYLKPGDTVSFSKTVSESDVYLFAGITGDMHANHVNEHAMAATRYGKRIAHGALLVGYMSNTSTRIVEQAVDLGLNETPVSLGYDRVRFLKAVCIGDTITVRYTVTEVDVDTRRSRARIVITNQHGDEVTAAEHILKWVAADGHRQ
ncbi:MaoC family dehydratase [Uliginosibacterium sp. sgz301328]|uniref:MaoC family dehydratase n=1 Tax=Uliginosibacterium sp. sgz301328 TaxID=3243764 RepID=UPI00359E5608